MGWVRARVRDERLDIINLFIYLSLDVFLCWFLEWCPDRFTRDFLVLQFGGSASFMTLSVAAPSSSPQEGRFFRLQCGSPLQLPWLDIVAYFHEQPAILSSLHFPLDAGWSSNHYCQLSDLFLVLLVSLTATFPRPSTWEHFHFTTTHQPHLD